MTKNPRIGYGIHSILIGLNIIKPLNITFTKFKVHKKSQQNVQWKAVYKMYLQCVLNCLENAYCNMTRDLLNFVNNNFPKTWNYG